MWMALCALEMPVCNERENCRGLDDRFQTRAMIPFPMPSSAGFNAQSVLHLHLAGARAEIVDGPPVDDVHEFAAPPLICP